VSEPGFDGTEDADTLLHNLGPDPVPRYYCYVCFSHAYLCQ
jgi:hypothetical protein